jgi:NAD(P)-dependent dehydrogenase (short-subunit alcohol dehydrogenase family)
MTNFTGKNIVITGVASGIGAAVVSCTSELGAQLMSMDINNESGEPVISAQGDDFITAMLPTGKKPAACWIRKCSNN